MANEISIYNPRTMGRIVERLPQERTFLRDTFFRNEEIFTTEKVDVDYVKGNRKVAPIVSRLVGGKIVPNTGYETKSYKPPLVAPEVITTVDDILKRLPGESLVSKITPEQRAVQKMAKDFVMLEGQIVRREELMCAQALFTGKIELIGDGVNEQLDFGFENTEKLAGQKKWTDQEHSDPIKDIERWRKEVQKKGFVNCDVAIMGSDAKDAFINHPKVKELLDVRNYNLATIKPKELPNGATYIGSINGLGMDIYTYNEWYLDDWTDPNTPTTKPLVPDNAVGLLSTAANYSMYYGAITLVDDKTKDFRTVAEKYVPDTYVERRPVRRFLNLSSAPLAVPHEIDSWYVGEVV